MNISKDIFYVGVNDRTTDLFEGQYSIPNGISYNSYVIKDEKIAVMDTVDIHFTHEWLDNIQNVLGIRKPDYLIIQHMEPDHSANILNFMKLYGNVKLVASQKAFAMIKNFFGDDFSNRMIVVKDGDSLNLGRHKLQFAAAPMVHCPEVVVYDLARCDMSVAVADSFRYSKLVLATTTYNAGIFPFMRDFILHLTDRNFQNRTVALIENGSWAPMAEKTMHGLLDFCKNIRFTDTTVHIMSALSQESSAQIEALSEELCRTYLAQNNTTADKNDLTALFKIGYGLYVVTSNDGKKDNGLILNTVNQVTNTPNRVAVTINKDNYSHHIIKQTGIMNVNCLSIDAPFSVFETFGFKSGRNTDKFAKCSPLRSDNGLTFLPGYINSFISLKVEDYVDLDTHGMFICSITEARVISDIETMTYSYYQNNLKPKPQTDVKKGFVCKVCGYVFEGDKLPEDFICPLCKHSAADFEPIK